MIMNGTHCSPCFLIHTYTYVKGLHINPPPPLYEVLFVLHFGEKEEKEIDWKKKINE